MRDAVTMFDAKKAGRRQASWVDLAPFEPRRSELASTFARMGVAPRAELDDPRTEFHYLSVLFAFAEWVWETGLKELELRSRDDDRSAALYSAAREKAVVGTLGRLHLHPSLSQAGAEMPWDLMVSMTANIGGLKESCRPALEAILSALDHADEAIALVAKRLAGGDSSAPSAVAMDYFDSHVEFIGDLDCGGFVPPNACSRASLEGSVAATFLHGRESELPMRLEDALRDGEFDRGALRAYLGQAAMYRRPLMIVNGKARATGATLGAAVRGLATGKPPILMDAAFQDGATLIAWSPFVPFPDKRGYLDWGSFFIKAFADMPSAEFRSAMFPVV